MRIDILNLTALRLVNLPCLCPMAQGGDLRATLDGPNSGQYQWRQRGARIATDVARGLSYIHSRCCFRSRCVHHSMLQP